MRKIVCLAFGLLCIPFAINAQVEIVGTQAVEVPAEASTGLKSVWVLNGMENAKVVYQSSTSDVTIEEFGALGGGYAQGVGNTEHSGSTYTFTPKNNMGYIITDGGQRICFWICDYSDSPYTISDVIPAENNCDALTLNLIGSAPEIPYYTINGRRMILDRQIKVEYNTLTYDSENKHYAPVAEEVTLQYATSSVHIPAPLCSTSVTITPGRFAKAFGVGGSCESQWIEPTAVQASTYVEQTIEEHDNQQNDGLSESTLGGSAPAEITFTAAVTDAAIYRRWEFSNTPDFDDPFITFSDLEVVYVFTEAGTTYVRFVCDNSYGTCQYESDTYTVTIGDSRLDCPNAFSPGNADGVNDEWKVSYRSIVQFHCEIFNRWGQRLASFDDPSQGWDGKVGSKTVPSGVYFYVINAVGSDGKKYKLSGDINVINSVRQTTVGSSSDSVE